jgi:DMSO/TMAO reductase YedYZ heme-binding membrane subunit
MIFRVLGIWSLLAAAVILINDGTRSLTSGTWATTRLGEHWYNLHPASLNASQAGIERYVHTALWDPVIVSILHTPSWIIFGIVGVLLYWIGRRRRRRQGFSK